VVARTGSGSLRRQLEEPGVIDEDRRTNQSLPVILRRVLTHFGTEAGYPRGAVALGNLSSAQLGAAYLAVVGLLGLALILYCRHPGDRLEPLRWSTEIALVTLGTLWYSPLVWSYHPRPSRRDWRSRSVRPAAPPPARATAAIWLVAMALFAVPVARILGHLLWASLFLVRCWSGWSDPQLWVASRRRRSQVPRPRSAGRCPCLLASGLPGGPEGCYRRWPKTEVTP